MAVIKCSNCENEILDTEIVCPYCDYPISKSKSAAYAAKEDSALSGETVKIPLSTKDLLKKMQSESEIGDAKSEENQPGEKQIEENQAETPVSKDIDTADSAHAEEAKVEPWDDEKKESAEGNTVKLSSADIQSETLRRSLEERRAERAAEKLEKKRKDHKLWILAVTIIGIFAIIYLAINIFSQMAGEKLFEKPRENKKAEKEVTSEAQMKELGYEFKSHTLTVIDESLVMQDYEAHEEKPWKEYIAGTNNLTIADGIETIGSHAFDDLKNVRHITLAPSVASIGESAFYGCTKLEKVVFDAEKSKLKSIGNYSFTDCKSLVNISFGPDLRRIGEGAFKSCENLEKIIIPDSVAEIGADAFLGCPNLVIHCSENSYAYEYATQNGIAVEIIGKEAQEDEDENVTTGANAGSISSGTSSKPNSTGSSKTETTNESEKPVGDNTPASGEASQETNPPSGTQPSESAPVAKPVAPTAPPSQVAPQIPALGGSGSDQSTQGSTSGTDVGSLLDALGKAQTQEEKDRILQQIQAATN